MCAWKRGTQNNLPGIIRMGHIKEFQTASIKETSIQTSLKIISFYDRINVSKVIQENYSNSPIAFICIPSNGLSTAMSQYILSQYSQHSQPMIYLHSHKFPHSILTCVTHEDVPYGSIILKDYQLVNCKVCVGDVVNFTLYLGDMFTYDTREGAIGDTKLRFKSLHRIQKIRINIQPKSIEKSALTSVQSIDSISVSNLISKLFYECIVTKEEVFVLSINHNHDNNDGHNNCKKEYIFRIHDVICDDIDVDINADEDKDDIVIQESYRGIVDVITEVYLESSHPNIRLLNQRVFQTMNEIKNVVYIISNDYEVFPVKRCLLRPCISLTSVVQYGKGKYVSQSSSIIDSSKPSSKILTNQLISTTIDQNTYQNHILSIEEKENCRDRIDPEFYDQNLIKVEMDACTFDRILLYLEHEARGEEFHFDPLLVNDLYDAAKSLHIIGLKDLCQKVLGSFQDRVRKTPIRLNEVISRNREGALPFTSSSDSSSNADSISSPSYLKRKRKDTLLIMSGMVFDITNWLDEHPGGSTIIPEQALNVDSTIFFEIYHASRQSFLYLKEFYIGELAKEDVDKVALPINCPHGTKASEAFMEQLHRLTESWRLKESDLVEYKQAYKSF